MKNTITLFENFSKNQVESSKHLKGLLVDMKKDIDKNLTDVGTMVAFYRSVRETWLTEHDISMDDKETIMWNSLMLKAQIVA